MQRAVTNTPGTSESRRPPPANVLLVDDRPENLMALSAILEPLQQRLVTVKSGFEALRELLLMDFAAILMDVQMPGMDGFETVNVIKSRPRSRHIPIIFITAESRETKYVYRGYSSGAVDYISKPFNAEILRSKVGVFIDLYNKEQALRRQSALIQDAIRRDAERRHRERERELEQQYLRDLTSKLESRVTERTRDLLEANRDLESFCYSIAHDLRAPVREIAVTSNMLAQDLAAKLSDAEMESLRAQCAAAKRLGRLIDDLLRLSRLGRKAILAQDVDLSDIAESHLARSSQSFPGIEYQVEVQPCVTAQGDPGLIDVLLQNLVENAFKYSPNGGKIRFGQVKEEDQAVYFLSDEGMGFDMKYERKLYLPFERLVPDGEFAGTGIGLALAEKIVAKHGGKLWANSEPGKGATFFFTLGGMPSANGKPGHSSIRFITG